MVLGNGESFHANLMRVVGATAQTCSTFTSLKRAAHRTRTDREAAMSEALPHTEMPAPRARLAETLALAREHVELRLGYEVELAVLEPIDRGGRMNLRAHWRRKAPALAPVCFVVA